ncbi:20135_t:CDS:10 [Entrophospora sp. SA101]|nr:22004_t:CDS:10 [Entrophospora sp. SA101]CAJ0753600.1 20135_t:CDS:10 [Entrophospora sp. SA101]
MSNLTVNSNSDFISSIEIATSEYFKNIAPSSWSYESFLATMKPYILLEDERELSAIWRKRFLNALSVIITNYKENVEPSKQVQQIASLLTNQEYRSRENKAKVEEKLRYTQFIFKENSKIDALKILKSARTQQTAQLSGEINLNKQTISNDDIGIYAFNPLLNIKSIEKPHLNAFVHPCLDAALWYIARINYEYGEIPSQNHVTRNLADGVGYMTSADKFQLVYVEGASPVAKEDKEIADAEKIAKNLRNMFNNIIKNSFNNRKCIPESLRVFGGQSFRLQIYLFYLDFHDKYHLHEVENANLPRDFSEIEDFVPFYECILKWALLVKEMTEKFEISRKNKRPSQNLSNDNSKKYVPLYVYDGWYHKPPKVAINLLLQEKFGPTQLKNSIENYYFKKSYQEALRLSLEYIDFVEKSNNHNLANDGSSNSNVYNNPNRLTSTREMLEIASQCALKLGDIELAVKCADKLVSNEPGHINLKGMIYSKDSIKWFVKYQKIRKNDYIVWKEIGKTFINHSENKTVTDSNNSNSNSIIYQQFALICLKHSYNIMVKSNWQHHIDYLEIRYLAEKKEIEDLINNLDKRILLNAVNAVNIVELTDWINNLKNLEEKEDHSSNNLDIGSDFISRQYQPLIRAVNNNEIIMQNMKWGLVPFWTKTSPDYPNIINCRDDSLLDGGKSMFTSMKNSKRCVIIAEGFYEWLKKGNKRLPYYTKRIDGELMLFAGLYDCVTFESSEEKGETGKEELYTFTIITTKSSKQLSFLHDRMPVILNNEKSLVDWLDADKKWSPDLAIILKPYEDGLEIYPVSQDVGKVVNNSPELIVPINSPQSKTNIANYFTKKEVGCSSKTEDGSGETEVELIVGSIAGKELSSSSSSKLKSETSNRRDLDNS